ncbi:MAG: hypothetical protein AABZ02_11775 [Bacteroidota bacterium]
MLSILAFLIAIQFDVCSQVVWLQDDFHRSAIGPRWKAASGQWTVDNGVATIRTTSYDQLLASSYYVYNTQPYSFEVTLRGLRAGVYFSLDDTASKAISHMVRFDEKSMLTGYFDGSGEFSATNTFESPKMPADWTVLRVDVDPEKKRYEVFIDGTSVGVDTNLVFPSGYIGLQASDGVSEFRSVRVFGNQHPKSPSAPPIGSKVTFQHVSYVRVQGTELFIYAPELRRLLQIDTAGKLLAAEPVVSLPQVSTVAWFGDRTYSIEGKRIIITNSAGIVIDSICERLVSPSSLLVGMKNLFVSDPGARAVFQFTLAGKLSRTIEASMIGSLKAPRGIDLYGKNGIVIADYDKLVFWDERSEQPARVSRGASSSYANVTWETNSEMMPFVEYGADTERWVRRLPKTPGAARSHRVELEGLAPLTRYSFRYYPALKTIPDTFSLSKTLHFATSPARYETMMSFTRLPVMCMVYRSISYRDKYPREQYPQIPDGRVLTEDEIVYLKQATDFNREFYFRNSRCRLVLDFDFYVVEDTLWLREVGDSDPYWLSPNERVTRDFERAARHFGKSPGDYAGLICPYAWVNYPPRRASALRDPSKKDTIDIRQAYGGGTYGVPAPWKHGKTAGYTSNPFQDRLSRQDWLITHEFHHQLDALMEASGYREYYHADQPWKMPGRFGEDFDFNAQIMRNARKWSWIGKLGETMDADRDGVPDNDPTLPFDEMRLGGSPSRRDTDGDGLPDSTEVTMGTSRGSSLNNADTDSDGIPDGSDPEPLYPIDPNIANIERTGDLESHPFGSIKSPNLSSTFYLGWNDSAFYISYRADKQVNVLFQIDADNDGWFHGFDNFQIRLVQTGDSVKVADYYLRDCSSWTDPPKDRRDILQTSDPTLTWTSPSQGNYVATLVIPRNERFGLKLAKGKRIGIRIGVQTATDLWVWDEMFERNYMMSVTLK